MRAIGFICIIVGFLAAALGVAQSMHAISPTQFSDRSLETSGGVLIFIGFILTAVAGLFATPSAFVTSAAPSDPAKLDTRTFTVTKTVTGFDSTGAHLPGVVERFVDASSKALLAGMLADLDDPAKVTKIQLQGGDPEQIKAQLRKFLSPSLATDTGSAASLPDASADVRSKQLQELDDLHAAGVLSDDQYQAVRAKLL